MLYTGQTVLFGDEKLKIEKVDASTKSIQFIATDSSGKTHLITLPKEGVKNAKY